MFRLSRWSYLSWHIEQFSYPEARILGASFEIYLPYLPWLKHMTFPVVPSWFFSCPERKELNYFLFLMQLCHIRTLLNTREVYLSSDNLFPACLKKVPEASIKVSDLKSVFLCSFIYYKVRFQYTHWFQVFSTPFVVYN